MLADLSHWKTKKKKGIPVIFSTKNHEEMFRLTAFSCILNGHCIILNTCALSISLTLVFYVAFKRKVYVCSNYKQGCILHLTYIKHSFIGPTRIWFSSVVVYGALTNTIFASFFLKQKLACSKFVSVGTNILNSVAPVLPLELRGGVEN